MDRRCVICGGPLPPRARRYCSPACREIGLKNRAAREDIKEHMRVYKRDYSRSYFPAHREKILLSQKQYKERLKDSIGMYAMLSHDRDLSRARRARGRGLKKSLGAHPIRILRDSLGLTQPEFAQRTGVPLSTLRAWETYAATPRQDALKRLAEKLGVDPSALTVPDLPPMELEPPPPPRQVTPIAAARAAAGLTQAQLAERIGVSPVALSGWETGKHQPKLTYLKKIAEALGVDWETLLPE